MYGIDFTFCPYAATAPPLSTPIDPSTCPITTETDSASLRPRPPLYLYSRGAVVSTVSISSVVMGRVAVNPGADGRPSAHKVGK